MEAGVSIAESRERRKHSDSAVKTIATANSSALIRATARLSPSRAPNACATRMANPEQMPEAKPMIRLLMLDVAPMAAMP